MMQDAFQPAAARVRCSCYRPVRLARTVIPSKRAGRRIGLRPDARIVGLALDDEAFMREALALAGRARDAGEVPVGAVVVIDGEIAGRGWNQPIGAAVPTAHAEIVAMRAAATATGNYRLTGATLYVTIEPCLMCVGAIVHARIGTVVFGALEPKAGAVASTGRFFEHPPLNHRVAVVAGVLAAESQAMMQAFFAERRGK